MKKIIVAISSFVALFGLCTGAYAFNYVHEDDFEINKMDEYAVEAKNGATAQVVLDDMENDVLRLTSAGSNISSVQKTFDAVSNIAIFDMDFKRESEAGGTTRVMQIYDSAKQYRPFLLTASNRGLTVRVGERQVTLNVPEYQNNVWLNFRVILDFNTSTYDMYVNGKQYCDDNAFFQDGAENAGIIQIQIDNGTGNGMCKVDNIAIYGINNSVIDNKILETENGLSEYVIGTDIGEYSKTRYLMFKDDLAMIRDMIREELDEAELLEVIQELEAATEEFDSGKNLSAGSEATVMANDINTDFDKTTIFTTESMEYAPDIEVCDNFGAEYVCTPTFEVISAPEQVELINSVFNIPAGTQGTLKFRVVVDDIYRNFTLYLKDYSRVEFKEIVVSDSQVKISGNITRNSDDAVTIMVSVADFEYEFDIEENEDGSFVQLINVPSEIMTNYATITVGGEYAHEQTKEFVYYAEDALEYALTRINNGTDEEISKIVKDFSMYLDVHTDTYNAYEQQYTDMITDTRPYSTAGGLNTRLTVINLILEISNAVREDIEGIITPGLSILEDNGFKLNIFEKLTPKNKTKFFTNSVGISGTDLGDICTELNKVLKKCSTAQVTGGGGGGTSSSQSGGNVSSGSGGTSSGGNVSSGNKNDYTVNPVDKDGESSGNTQVEDSEHSEYIPFEDEEDAEWAKNAIEFLKRRNIIDGYENKIRPNDPVTRGEVIKMIVEAFDIEAEIETSNSSEWWADYAQKGMSAGIIKGYSDGEFHGNDLIVRQDIAVILSRVIDNKQIPVYDMEEGKFFNDSDEISDYAYDAIYDLQKWGVLSGVGENMFAPHSYVTRAQAIMAIYNVLKIEVDVLENAQ